MGHGSSKAPPAEGSSSGSSRMTRFRHRLRRVSRRRGSKSSRDCFKLVSADDFAGIALLTLLSGEMKFKDKWLACVSLGEQTYRTDISDQTDKPVWNSEKKFLLESNGPHVARVSVYETNRLSKNNLVGFCDINLLDCITRDSDAEVVELLDPSTPNIAVGKLSFSCFVEDPTETETAFVRKLLSIVDYDQDGKLSFSEFSELVNAFGNQLAEDKKEELFKAADNNGDGSVSMDELASLLAHQQDKDPLITCCPVCGENLMASDKLSGMIHMAMCFNEGTGRQVMTGGFLTDQQAAYGWMFKLSEWAHISSYEVGPRSGSSASHILVFDRITKRLVEEIIDGKIIMSMRALYQSKIGLNLVGRGVKELLQELSEKQGKKMNSTESARNIPKFIETFRDQINLNEVKYPLNHFKTFNEFFIRELKPGVRPIASVESDKVAVCAADCRLMAFRTIDESLRFWIKGRKFSVQGLLTNKVSFETFLDGTLVIFRLAPQDYHRFHFPVSGVVEKFVDVPGSLYTVNPIAVNSKHCDVFTENKRVVSIISTKHFGKVAFVAIGATMVGSITFTKKEGDHVQKGDEFGYFSFGGSTAICVFEKGAIQIDNDLLENSERSLETLVCVGMQLGVATKN
ncbi:hypothetical protein V2J09_008187 [Rumex salicifolius]